MGPTCLKQAFLAGRHPGFCACSSAGGQTGCLTRQAGSRLVRHIGGAGKAAKSSCGQGWEPAAALPSPCSVLAPGAPRSARTDDSSGGAEGAWCWGCPKPLPPPGCRSLTCVAQTHPISSPINSLLLNKTFHSLWPGRSEAAWLCPPGTEQHPMGKPHRAAALDVQVRLRPKPFQTEQNEVRRDACA